MMSLQRAAIVVVCLLTAVAPVAAQPGKSLGTCNKTLAKETTKLAGGIQKAVSKCLDKIQGGVLAKGDPVSAVAKACASSFTKIANADAPDKTLTAKFAVKVAKACDPTAPDTKATHTAAEILDPNDAAGLQAGLLGAYCGEFEGDGGLEAVGEWIDCATAAAACSALQQVAVEYPRAPEWLGDIATAITALDPNEPKYTDAAATANALLARLDSNLDGVADISCGPAAPSHTQRYVDNTDGTITDNETGLEWEKKVKRDLTADLANLQDGDNVYPWSGSCSGNFKPCQPDTASSAACFAGVEGDTRGCDECTVGEGTCTVMPNGTVWQWLNDLNTASFGGHSDWRLSSVYELLGIVDFTTASPATLVAFNGASCGAGCTDVTDPACSCTTTFYLTATTERVNTDNAWGIRFSGVRIEAVRKTTSSGAVRAVRGGS